MLMLPHLLCMVQNMLIELTLNMCAGFLMFLHERVAPRSLQAVVHFQFQAIALPAKRR